MQAHVTRHQPRLHAGRGRFFPLWSGLLAALIGLLFVGVTLLTLAVWIVDPGRGETNPVVDLGFFALGGILVAGGLASQVRSPRDHVAGFQQAVAGCVALALAGLAGERVEPLWGGLAFLALVVVGAVAHPARAELLPAVRRASRPMLAIAALAALPAGGYAAAMLDLARSAGPSCFAGQCARGDRFAEAAALAIAIVLVTLLAALRPSGWRLAAVSVGAGAIIVGAASVALPGVAGSLGTGWGAAAVAWGLAAGSVARLSAGDEDDGGGRR